MRAASRESLSQLLTTFDRVLAAHPQRAAKLGREAFALADLFLEQPPLAAALTDPARTAEDKERLAQELTAGRVSPDLETLLTLAARQRWSQPHDLAEAFDEAGMAAHLADADNHDALEKVEDEAFRIVRLLAEQSQLRRALMNRRVAVDRRAQLMDEVMRGRVTDHTRRLARRAVRISGIYDSTRSLLAALNRVAERAAARRESVVASVITAVRLTPEECARLTEILTRRMGRPVTVHQGIDRSVLGGMRIMIGSDVIDGTLATRISQLRRTVASAGTEKTEK